MINQNDKKLRLLDGHLLDVGKQKYRHDDYAILRPLCTLGVGCY